MIPDGRFRQNPDRFHESVDILTGHAGVSSLLLGFCDINVGVFDFFDSTRNA
jgi:hypothetical protein